MLLAIDYDGIRKVALGYCLFQSSIKLSSAIFRIVLAAWLSTRKQNRSLHEQLSSKGTIWKCIGSGSANMSYSWFTYENKRHRSTHLKEELSDTTKVQMFLDLLQHPASFQGASEFSLPWGFTSLSIPSLNQMLAVSNMYRQATKINFEKTISSFSCLTVLFRGHSRMKSGEGE